MKGFCVVPQFFNGYTTWDQLVNGKRTGDALAYEQVVHKYEPELLKAAPRCPHGCVVFMVEDDGYLVRVATNYDSSG